MEGPNPSPRYREKGRSFKVPIEKVLEDTRDRVRVLLRALKDKLEKGEFGMVLGIDAGGRVPTLMLAQAVQEIKPLAVRFVSVGKSTKDFQATISKLTDHFSSKKFVKHCNPPCKVMVLDDVVESGSIAGKVIFALDTAGFEFEVATLSPSLETSATKRSKAELRKKMRTDLLIGGNEYPAIYNKKQMACVKKVDGEIHSTQLTPSDTGYEPHVEAHLKEYFAEKNVRLGDDESNVLAPKEVLKYTRKRLSEIAHELAVEMGWSQAGKD